MQRILPMTALFLVLAGCNGGDSTDEPPTLDEADESITRPEQTTIETATSTPTGADDELTVAETGTPGPAEGTPLASATDGGEMAVPCPIDQAACDLAYEVEAALQQADVEAVLDLIAPATVDCTVEPEHSPIPDPAADYCEAHPGAETLEGYIVGARQSDAITYVDDDMLAQTLATFVAATVPEPADELGPGALELYTVADVSAPDCPSCYAMVFSQIVAGESSGYQRVALELHVQQRESGWQWGFLAEGSPDPTPQVLTGGEYLSTEFHYLSPYGDAAAPKDALYYSATVEVRDTSGECLNVRTEPATDAAVADCLPPGSLARIVDGPVDGPATGDGFTWWRILYSNGPTVEEGWVADAYLTPVVQP